MQMSQWVWSDTPPPTARVASHQFQKPVVRGLGIAGGLVAFAMHEEAEGWKEAKAVACSLGKCVVGVPFGAVVLLHARRQELQVLRKPLTILSLSAASSSGGVTAVGRRQQQQQMVTEKVVAAGSCWSFAHLV